MLEQALLREQIQTLLASEAQVQQAYAHAATATTDSHLREQFEQFGKDTHRHIRLAQQLLEILG